MPRSTSRRGAELDLRGQTTFEGGTYTGDGTLQQTGNASVVAATTIAVDNTTWTVRRAMPCWSSNDHLTLNVEHVETGSNVFNGTITINNPGRLIVNTPGAWTMAGTMNLSQNATREPVLRDRGGHEHHRHDKR